MTAELGSELTKMAIGTWHNSKRKIEKTSSTTGTHWSYIGHIGFGNERLFAMAKDEEWGSNINTILTPTNGVKSWDNALALTINFKTPAGEGVENAKSSH